MKRKNFTIIELLVVIAIIAILAGLLLPAIGGVRNKAKKTKAKAQCNSIVMAIKNYESTYGLLPWTDGNSNNPAGDGTNDDAVWYGTGSQPDYYNTLMEILTCTDGPDADSVVVGLPAGNNNGNARGIRFLDVPENYTTVGFVDPWGNKFGIAMDLTYSNMINFNGDSDENTATATIGGVSGVKDLNLTVAVWSFGPGTKGDGTGSDNNSFGDKTSPKDDVASWIE
ncbi:MAG TPA: hypothetical protein DET40_16855 [Lentisphaeria bacterium]|nr:MAG: hypothetical protein A2X45_21355 [Lentisphaerae bacterium GWF2_50_93]HCE45211.1 hypothetical protein [Lentisphaeria bacterium]